MILNKMQKDSREKGTDMHDKIVQIQEEVKKEKQKQQTRTVR